jgi:hypothetical protein
MPRLARSAALLLLFAVPASAAQSVYVVPDLYAPAAGESKDPAAADKLVQQATDSAAEGQTSRALQLATEALRHDPDNAVARRVLGYEQHAGLWLTPFQQKQIGRGFVWDARFGWIKREDLPRYEAGERRDGRRWVSTAEDARRHATIDTGWQVRTDHFLVTTNHSLAAGAQLAADLEGLFQVWRQSFAGYYLGDAEVKARFEGTRTARSRSKPFNVIYHKDKPQYVAALRHKQPRIDETLGIYFDDLREAHFYAGEGFDSATLYHEAVHQLFQESRRAPREVGADHGFWLVEGVACYFESLAPAEAFGEFKIGGADAGRVPAARHRLLVDGYYVPLAELAALGKGDLQRRDDLAPLYSQMAGLATYLIEGEAGAMREPLVAHLRALYEGRARPNDLFERLGKTPDELDAGYRRFLQSLPQ